MTKEDKELLLRDLCARLPYGVKGIITYNGDKDIFAIEGIYNDILSLSDSERCYLEDFKPYLFPLSSMTEEQYNEFFSYSHNIEMAELKASCDYLKAAYIGDDARYRWLNAHHFDYRGLIEKGLALDATGLSIY